MAYTRKHVAKAPVDQEIGVEARATLEYYVTLPDTYNDKKNYGVVFCITAWGDRADSDYQLKKLRPYIADNYNLIVVGIRYHNDLRRKEDDIKIDLERICNFYNIPRHELYNLTDGDLVLDKLFQMLHAKQIFSLDSTLAVETKALHYSSFGFMPAIDHIYVLEDLIKNYNIDKKQIIAYGSSYGGYVALMLGKIAPKTFSLIIDNSGFCYTDLKEVFGGMVEGIGGSFSKEINGRRYQIPITRNTIWSLDEMSENYFSDAHRKIRNVLLEEHMTKSETVYCIYHSVKDILIPIEVKDKFCNAIGKDHDVHYWRITNEDIDGVTFKTLDHGMEASLRGLFDLSLECIGGGISKITDLIDFDLDSIYEFDCGDRVYKFSYSKDGLKVEIIKKQLIKAGV